MKNILISTGGSGGHVVPATIIYQHLKTTNNIFMTSDDRGVKFMENNKYNIEIINVPNISKNIFLLPLKIVILFSLIVKSLFLLKSKKIEILISTGGYMSFPLCLAAKILNLKIFLFEPNMVLGRSNKLFINSCEKIFCYSNKIKNFPKKHIDKISVIPALLRKKFYNIEKTKNIDESINLLVIGGSQGAKVFDTFIKTPLIELSKRYNVKIYQQTNFINFESLKKFYEDNHINHQLFEFNEDISNLMSKANICITRAGASTLAELVFLNLPFIACLLYTSPSPRD